MCIRDRHSNGQCQLAGKAGAGLRQPTAGGFAQGESRCLQAGAPPFLLQMESDRLHAAARSYLGNDLDNPHRSVSFDCAARSPTEDSAADACAAAPRQIPVSYTHLIIDTRISSLLSAESC